MGIDLATARTRLEELRAQLDASAASLTAENARDDGELSSYDQHPADTATTLSDADREEASLEVVADQRSQVLAALARIDDGTYGRCVDCGQPLPEERLQARPEAARCVADQLRFEEGR